MAYKIGERPDKYITSDVVLATCDKLHDKHGNMGDYMSEEGMQLIAENETLLTFIMTFIVSPAGDETTIGDMKKELSVAILTAALFIELFRTAIGGLEMEVMCDETKDE
tara:strand:+ start:7174 stop:7500 length:327 start_codon:yes stop_codon:yes gene_type:complete